MGPKFQPIRCEKTLLSRFRLVEIWDPSQKILKYRALAIGCVIFSGSGMQAASMDKCLCIQNNSISGRKGLKLEIL